MKRTLKRELKGPETVKRKAMADSDGSPGISDGADGAADARAQASWRWRPAVCGVHFSATRVRVGLARRKSGAGR